MRYYFILITSVIMIIFTTGCGQAADDGMPDMGFLNYGGAIEMREGLQKLFPPGTPKQFVDRSLIQIGGAEYRGKLEGMFSFPNESNVHGYEYQRPFYLRFLHDGHFTITIFFDDNDRVKAEVITKDGERRNSITTSGPTGL